MKKVNLSESTRLINLISLNDIEIQRAEREVERRTTQNKALLKVLQSTQGRNISDLLAEMVHSGIELSFHKKTSIISLGLVSIDNGSASVGDTYLGEVDFSYLNEIERWIEFVELHDIAHLVDYEYPDTDSERPSDPITLSRNDLR